MFELFPPCCSEPFEALDLCFEIVGLDVQVHPALVLDAGGIGFPDGSVQSSALPHRAAVAKTGQASCFATDGTPRDCAEATIAVDCGMLT